jgi:hypothetical protein
METFTKPPMRENLAIINKLPDTKMPGALNRGLHSNQILA